MRDLRIYHEAFDSYTHERLYNWSRCVRVSGWHTGHCYSVEGRYSRQSETLRNLDDEEERRQPAAPEPDQRDGLIIERVVSAPTFPRFDREMLKGHYVHRDLPRITAKRLGITVRDYDYSVCRSIMMVRDRLYVPTSVRERVAAHCSD